MSVNPYIYPVSRIGNEQSPRLIILLNNPGRAPENIDEIAESKMGFKNTDDCLSGMQFAQYRKVCKWWDDLLARANKFGIDDKDILSLEYYIYHTLDSGKMPPKSRWRDLAIQQLAYNKRLLNKHIANGDAIIYSYYNAAWQRECPHLLEYSKYFPSAYGQAQPVTKQNELERVLQTCQLRGIL